MIIAVGVVAVDCPSALVAYWESRGLEFCALNWMVIVCGYAGMENCVGPGRPTIVSNGMPQSTIR